MVRAQGEGYSLGYNALGSWSTIRTKACGTDGKKLEKNLTPFDFIS